jgi:hypothetical protein
MSARMARVTKTEVARLISGAKAAGLTVFGVRLDDDGLTVLTNAQPMVAEQGTDDDEADFEARLQRIGKGGKGKNTLLRRP